MAVQKDVTNQRTVGCTLAAALSTYRGSRGNQTTIVLGLTRGGVAVAAEVAATLRLPLDVLVVQKIAVRPAV